MKLHGLLHLNLRCTQGDIPKIEAFYRDVAGMHVGYRPDFKNEGIWLYTGDEPLIHVSVRVSEGFLSAKHNSSVDHVAFRMTGAAAFREHVRGLDLEFQEQNVPEAGYQIFLHDPVGTLVEFNFPNEEAPRDIESGTLAPRTKVMADASR